MTAEIEIKLRRMRDPDVHRRPGGNVPTLPALLLLVCAEEAGVMSFLHNDEGDARLVVRLQLDAGLSYRRQLVLENL